MTLEIIFRYLHFISIFSIVGTLVSEHLLLKKVLTRSEIGLLSRVDAVYGIASIALVGAGLTLWLGGLGKPFEYYRYNWIFLTKMACLTLLGLLSIFPTVFFIRNRKGKPEEKVDIPNSIFWMLRLELLLLLIIPLLAGLMAKGVGYFG